MVYEPGDVIFLRSAVIEHYISPYIGRRCAIVMLTKHSVETYLNKEQEADEQDHIDDEILELLG